MDEGNGRNPDIDGADVPEAAPVVFAGSGETGRRLFCFPFAGGAASTYRLWPRTLPADVDVVFVQFPGRNPADKRPPLTSITEMVASALPLIESQADLPYALFGHSMGSVVAYEVVSELEKRAANGGPFRTPSHLYVSARRPPDVAGASGTIRDLPDDQFLAAINESYGGVPEVALREPELMALFLPILRADVIAFETYQRFSDHRVRCGLSAFGGTGDTHATAADLDGWSRVAERPVPVDVFSGDHFYINDQAAAVTAKIAEQWPAPAITETG